MEFEIEIKFEFDFQIVFEFQYKIDYIFENIGGTNKSKIYVGHVEKKNFKKINILRPLKITKLLVLKPK